MRKIKEKREDILGIERRTDVHPVRTLNMAEQQ